MEKISRCCTKLEEWGGGLVREMREKMGYYRKEMQRYRARRDVFGIQKYDTTRWEYMKLLEKQEIFWRQRTKQFWLRDGEKNTRFFHKFASTRKEHNKIKKLKNENGSGRKRMLKFKRLLQIILQTCLLVQAQKGGCQQELNFQRFQKSKVKCLLCL